MTVQAGHINPILTVKDSNSTYINHTCTDKPKKRHRLPALGINLRHPPGWLAFMKNCPTAPSNKRHYTRLNKQCQEPSTVNYQYGAFYTYRSILQGVRVFVCHNCSHLCSSRTTHGNNDGDIRNCVHILCNCFSRLTTTSYQPSVTASTYRTLYSVGFACRIILKNTKGIR